MEYRVRGKLPSGAPVITRVSADSEAEAMAKAGAEFRSAGHDLTTIKSMAAKELTNKPSTKVYVGKVPAPRAPRAATAPAAAGSPAATAPAAGKPAAAPAKPATSGAKK